LLTPREPRSRLMGVASPPTGVGALRTGASQAMLLRVVPSPLAAMGVTSEENSDDWLPNIRDVRPEFGKLGRSCTCSAGAELRRPMHSDGVAAVLRLELLMLENGVPPPKSMELRLLGQMLAGVTRPTGVAAPAAIGVGARLDGSRGSRLSGGFGQTARRHDVEALLGVTVASCGDNAGKPPHAVGTWLIEPRIAFAGSIGATLGCGAAAGAALVAVEDVTGAAASKFMVGYAI